MESLNIATDEHSFEDLLVYFESFSITDSISLEWETELCLSQDDFQAEYKTDSFKDNDSPYRLEEFLDQIENEFCLELPTLQKEEGTKLEVSAVCDPNKIDKETDIFRKLQKVSDVE